MSSKSIDISHVPLTVHFSGTMTFKESFNNKTIIIVTLLLRLYQNNSSSEAQQSKPVGVTINGDRQNCHWSMKPSHCSGGKALSNKYVLNILQTMAIVSEDLIVTGS